MIPGTYDAHTLALASLYEHKFLLALVGAPTPPPTPQTRQEPQFFFSRIRHLSSRAGLARN